MASGMQGLRLQYGVLFHVIIWIAVGRSAALAEKVPSDASPLLQVDVEAHISHKAVIHKKDVVQGYHAELAKLNDHLADATTLFAASGEDSLNYSRLLDQISKARQQLTSLLQVLPKQKHVADTPPPSAAHHDVQQAPRFAHFGEELMRLGKTGPAHALDSPHTLDSQQRVNPAATLELFATELTRVSPRTDAGDAVSMFEDALQAGKKLNPWDTFELPTDDKPAPKPAPESGEQAGPSPEGVHEKDGTKTIKAAKPKTPSWIMVIILVIAITFVAGMTVTISPFGVQEYGKRKKNAAGVGLGSGGEEPVAEASWEPASQFAQVVLPYWVPTAQNSRGVLFAALFLCMLGTTLSVTYWLAVIVMNIGRSCIPFMQDGKRGGWETSTELHVLAIIGLFVWPMAFFVRWKEVRGRLPQWGYLGLAFFLMFVQSAWNIISTFIMRKQMDALFFSDPIIFWQCWRIFLVGVAVNVTCIMTDTWIQKMLGLRWRTFVTHHFLDLYMSCKSYYKLDAFGRVGEKVDNPDQRISEDAGKVSMDLLVFILALVHSMIGLVSFATVLWNLLPTLTMVCVAYAVAGCVVGLCITWKLVVVNYVTQRNEADFRFAMVHIRGNTEPIAFYGGEAREKGIAGKRFEGIVSITRQNIRWMMVAMGFKSGYYSIATMLPTMLVFNSYFEGTLDFGGITQAGSAFSTTLVSLSFVIENMSTISDLSTAANRLSSMLLALKRHSGGKGPDDASPNTEGVVNANEVALINTSESRLEVRDLTARTPTGEHVICRSLNMSFGGPSQEPVRLIVVGNSGIGKSSLMRVVAGLWKAGKGEVVRPSNADCLFLPQKPYMPLGNLRLQLLYPDERSDERGAVAFPQEIATGGFRGSGMPKEASTSDTELQAQLSEVGLGDLPKRFEEGFNGVCEWSRVLSLGEQQRLASVRCVIRRPKLSILDEATSALSIADEKKFYKRLMNMNLSYVSVGHRDSLLSYHDQVLELKGEGEWRLHKAEDYRAIMEAAKKAD